MKNSYGLFFVLIISITSSFAQNIALVEVQKHIGKTVTVCGKIFGGRYMSNAQNTPTLLNMGGNYPNHLLTLVIYGENLKDFPEKSEVHFANKEVCVTGLVIEYRGKPEIILKSTAQIKMDVPNIAVKPDAKNEISSNAGSTNSTINTSKMPDSTSTTNPGNPQAVPKNSTSSVDRIKLFKDVNLRTGPGVDYSMVSRVKAGTIVSVLFSSNGWSQVTVKTNPKKKSIADEGYVEGYIKDSVLKGNVIRTSL